MQTAPVPALEVGQRLVHSPVDSVPSAITQLAQNNKELSSLEALQCRQAVRDGRKDHSTVAHEIAMAHAHLEHLTQELQDIQEYVDAHQQLLQSPRQLNQDVLMQIFHFACAADGPLQQRHSLDDTLPHWRLAQVCTRWRNIIINDMFSLWTTITLQVSTENARLGYRLDRLLRRSGRRELEVCLVFAEGYTPTSSYRPLLFHLLTTCDRWRSLHLYANSSCIQNFDMSILNNNLPRLQHFTHAIEAVVDSDVSWNARLAWSKSATLLTSYSLAGKSGIPVIDFARITELRWIPGDRGPSAWRSLPESVGKCSNLKKLDVDCVSRTTQPRRIENGKPVPCRHLRELIIRSVVEPRTLEQVRRVGTTEAERILDHIVAPALRTMTLTGLFEEGTRAINDLLCRSKISLRCLTLPEVPGDEIAPVLDLCPALVDLTLDLKKDHEASAMEALILPASGQENVTSRCMKLRALEVRLDPECDITTVLVDVIHKMLNSRRSPSQDQLQSFFVRSNDAKSTDAILQADTRIRALVKGGLQLVVQQLVQSEP